MNRLIVDTNLPLTALDDYNMIVIFKTKIPFQYFNYALKGRALPNFLYMIKT